MTREERDAAIAYIKGYRKLDEDLHNISPKDSISYYATDKCLKYWDMAIKALEQGDVLDKIRTEIEQTAYEEQKHDEKWAIGLRYAVKVIDKYKTEQR